jgi:hypothetical protein
MRSFLRQIMTDASFDQTVSVLAHELLDIGRRLWVRGAICIALKGDCRQLMIGLAASLASRSGLGLDHLVSATQADSYERPDWPGES